ncbi:hypothetical protein N9242_07340, partial [Vicingaceae bacterium]|nr:hypothetical protein [Vicingaceae bacterium]
IIIAITYTSCKKDDETTIEPTASSSSSNQSEPNLVFKFYFDSTADRLDNFGNPSSIPSGNAAQSPSFNMLSFHSLELAPDSNTAVGFGTIVYKGAETTVGGSNAVDFDQAIITTDGAVAYSKPLSQITAGTYKWLRSSLAYQNYDIQFLSNGQNLTGTLASFVGFNNYITNYTMNTQSVAINANKTQGYWGFETTVLGTTYLSEGQSTGTTVPNPLAGSSPINPGSCVVTGDFPTPLVITGNETSDIVVSITLSTNNSFEWKEYTVDGFFEPSDGTNPGDSVVDMGLRGLFPTWQ